MGQSLKKIQIKDFIAGQKNIISPDSKNWAADFSAGLNKA